jgi:hypothetical protein
MIFPARFPFRVLALAGLAGFLLVAPPKGATIGLAASSPSAEIDPESGKPADELGSESDEPRGFTGRTNLPLPRFASLRGSQVNVRTGPGVRYPIDWVFQRRSMPV